MVTLAAVGLVVFAGTFLIRPVFRYIHQAHLREMYTALALLLVVSIAVLMEMVGLSPALGTFLVGVKHFQPKWTPVWRPEMRQNKGLELFWRLGHCLNCFSAPTHLLRQMSPCRNGRRRQLAGCRWPAPPPSLHPTAGPD